MRIEKRSQVVFGCSRLNSEGQDTRETAASHVYKYKNYKVLKRLSTTEQQQEKVGR